MEKPRVFVTRKILEPGLSTIREHCTAEVWEGELPPDRETLLAKVRGVDGILSLLTDRMDAAVMDAAGPQLKVISNHAVGYDNVDVEGATERGIRVGNTPGILTDATADFTWALLMAAARRIPEAITYVKAGHWRTWGPDVLLGSDFAGATLGIIGFGRIGNAVARRASGFGMNILYADNSPKHPGSINARQVDLETLLATSDFITLHVPLTPETRHLINGHTLSLMKPTAILVNTARGDVVDQDALYQALANRQIRAAALDVTTPEPLPTSKNEPHPLLTLDNCLVAPHIASASWHTRSEMARLAAENLVAGVKGLPLPHLVNQ